MRLLYRAGGGRIGYLFSLTGWHRFGGVTCKEEEWKANLEQQHGTATKKRSRTTTRMRNALSVTDMKWREGKWNDSSF